MKRISALVGIIATLAFSATVMSAEKAALPKGYQKWEKSSRKIETDKRSLFYGIHYIYVDKKAMKGYKAGGQYPEGSMFVVVNYNIKEVGGKPVEGKKNMIVLMKKDKKCKDTGGWFFAGFSPNGKPSGIDPVKNCYECHLKEAGKTDLVISKYSNFR
jgi:hypothetical protein